jgi:hypothetical protein
MKDIQISVPVLLVAFNRPDTTKVVFQKIREARPQKLYVAVDGPRLHKEGEDKLVEQVKAIVNNVGWHCETHYKYNETNKGAEVTVSSAIQWVFETEEYAIILEDDIIAPLAFFRFAQEMLIRYKDDDRIATVTGSNFTPIPVPDNADYFFAKYGHSWGWATWKRAWQGFNLYLKVPDKHLHMDFLSTITNSRAESRYYQKLFTALQKRGPGNSTWDHTGLYYFRVNNKLSVIPRVNLTSNIGVYGLHAKGETEHHFRPVDETFVAKTHPKSVECFTEYDKHHFKTYINKKSPLFFRAAKKIKRIFRLN